MMSDAVWRPLEQVLKACRDTSLQPVFWLRDDDAIEPSAALDRLIGLTGEHAVPLALAVIPAGAWEPLADTLMMADHVTTVVHGWSHENHAGPGEKKQELGPHRPMEIVLGDLRRGLRKIEDMFGSRMRPVLVPPWNRIDPGLLPHLPAIGYEALSAFGLPRPAPLAIINSTVDIIDWHGTRGCRDHAALVAGIVGQLRASLAAQTVEPVGILTHHLVHDQSAWMFLERLFAVTSKGARGSWLSIGDLVSRASDTRKIKLVSPSSSPRR